MHHLPRAPRRRRALAVLGWAALGLAALLLAAPVAAQDEQSVGQSVEQPIDQRILDKKNQLKQLQYEREQIRLRLSKAQDDEQALSQEIESLSNDIRASRRRVRDMQRERDALAATLEQQDAELQTLDADIAANRARMTQRLARLYRFSKAREHASLFALARYKTFFKDSAYLSLLKRRDEAAVAEHVRLKAEVQEKRRAVQDNLAELARLRQSLLDEMDTLRERETALKASLQELRGNQGIYNAYLADLQGVLERMETAIAGLEQRSREAALGEAVEDPETLRGKLPPPVAGQVVAKFGRRDPRYSLEKFQRGMVIRTGEEAAVTAVAPGRVVHAGPFRGYQELVVLDHGKGLFTVYGHLTELRVQRDARVAAGARLGTATYQPIDGGYSVYFELRLNGKPDDPLNWLQPGALASDPQAGLAQ
ncbi:MAG: peptidoglycan DD-metalloendopeptidase family protein [Candidatus Lambdaproteobacteria bacterium]|nr:peptidoglycan DD-metalloendopeptidase family protein [Candidatus Lambdaproteobacteria bacterium]